MRAVCATLVLLLVGAFAAPPAAGAVEASIEPRVIDELDTARLIVRATGSNEAERLDLQALEQDFEVLTSQTSSQYRSVNGRVESWVEYQIMLRPRHAGDLTIPPIRVGGDATAPLTLHVRGIEPSLREAIDRMVFFESELTRNPVYVQAQTVLVRRLYYSSGAQIYSDLPGIPEIPDAVVMPLGDTTSSTQIRDGQRYGIIEQRFAIFPEQSGELTIPAISITSSVRVHSGGRMRRSGVRIATEPLTLEVLAIPASYPVDQPWLPAEDLRLSDRWTPVDARIDVGDPVTRTLSARVQGNVSSVIPPLTPAVPDSHFRRYPEPPELEEDAGRVTVTGVREQTYSIIPTAPGTVNLPPTEVVWWDVNAEAVRTASAPGRTFWISGTPAQAPETDAATATDPAGRTAAESSRDGNAPSPADVDVRKDQVPWPGPERRRALWLALLAFGVATALMLGWSRWRSARSGVRPPSRRAAWQALRQTCRDGSADDIHHALLAYLRRHYRATTAESMRCFREAGYGEVLDTLNASRYRSDADHQIAGDQVITAIRALRRRRQRPRNDPLPALYD